MSRDRYRQRRGGRRRARSQLAEAKKLKGVVRTRSPGCTPAASQGEPQRVGAGGASHGLARAAEIGHFALEMLDFRAEHVVLRRAHASHGLQDFGADLLILALQIQHGNSVERLDYGLRGGFAAGDWAAAGRGLVPSPLGDAGRDAGFVDGAFTAKCPEKEIVAGRKKPAS